ncbi:LysM peptidoglycan-binding domain-containing protein [Allokutzneria sp. NRRL B-24872]|uniref:LysM peptidoglycan-binding domain-containing protein n=1 Tax=Allokutzneria sp. NRRL B-24872 TaxID=1137961 RepID=UPI001FEF717D|nr:LysM peptidoglycan-binding domain-containing protein [Allokutzneria sp. NRRL B-24872]
MVVELHRRPLRGHPGGGTVIVPAARHAAIASRAVACRVRKRSLAARVRGMLAALALTAVAVVGLGLLAQLRGIGDGPDVPESVSVVEVDPGESLWQLARRVAPDSPSGAVIERIVELNELSDHVVHPGQPLRVPDGRAQR